MAGLNTLQNAINKTRKKVGDWTGLGPVFNTATSVSEKYYPDEIHNGRGDAMRHIMASALAAQKYGAIPAAMLGYANEIISLDPMDESGMDIYNNALGRELGAKYKDPMELEYSARDLIEEQKAKTLSGYYKNYAEGGLIGCNCSKCRQKFAQGGIVPSANGFMVGGLNLINPKSTSNGPLNVQWNTNNMIQSARAGR